MSFLVLNDKGALMFRSSTRKKAKARAKRALRSGTRGCAVCDVTRSRVYGYGTLQERR